MTGLPVYDRQLIGGAICQTGGRTPVTLHSPYSGLPDRLIVPSSAEDLGRAVAAARATFATWSLSDIDVRAAILEAIADEIASRRDEIAATIAAEIGTPLPIAGAVQVDLPVQVLRGYARTLVTHGNEETIDRSTTYYRPYGVAGSVSPWNYPLHQAIAKIGGALAAGCSMVVKPGEITPRTNMLLAEVLRDRAPAGVVNIVQGGPQLGELLFGHDGIDIISFTGSERAGRAVAALAAERMTPCLLELGGKSAAIVLPDADLNDALPNVVRRGLLNSGQTCNAPTRLIVPEASLGTVIEIAKLAVEKTEPKLGPLATLAGWEKVNRMIRQAKQDGAVLIAGGEGHPEGREVGYYARATLFLVDDPSLEIFQEEVFGPVLTITPYSSLEDAIRLANATRFGLACYIWGSNKESISALLQRVRSGQVDLGRAAFNPLAPFGGIGASGWSRELGLHGIRSFQFPMSVQSEAA